MVAAQRLELPCWSKPLHVMAGLVPAIHVLLLQSRKKDVDARHKAGHDGVKHHALCYDAL